MYDIIQLIATTIVCHIPEWLPWFSYKPLARVCYNIAQEVKHEPFRFVKESMVIVSCLHVCVHLRNSLRYFLAQWYGATFTCSRESTGVGGPKRIRTKRARANNCRSFRVDIRRSVITIIINICWFVEVWLIWFL
jgi:hypothetical protein